MSPKLTAAAREAGLAALERGDLEVALDQLGRAHEADPDAATRDALAMAAHRLGVRELTGGSLARARDELDRAFGLAPSPAVAAALARAAWATGDLDAASRALAAELATGPRALGALALVRARQRLFEPGRGLLARARAGLAALEEAECASLARTLDLVDLVLAASDPDPAALTARGSREAQTGQVRELAAHVTREHDAAVRAFLAAARPAADQVLLATRRALAEELAARTSPAGPERAARLAAALTEGLAPAVTELAAAAAAALVEVQVALTEPWTAPAARVLAALVVERRGLLALAHLGELPESAPPGLFLVLEIAGLIAAGQMAPAMGRLSDPAAAALPPRTVLGLVEAALERLSPADAPLELFQALAKLTTSLTPARRADLAGTLLSLGDPTTALALTSTLPELSLGQRQATALAAGWLGADELAAQSWQVVVRHHLDTPPGTPTPDWLPHAVVHLADLWRAAKAPDRVTDLLRRGASRLAGSAVVLESWIDHLEGEKMQRDLLRAADSARRAAGKDPALVRLQARALSAAGEHAAALKVIEPLARSDAACTALYERVVQDLARTARDAAGARAVLAAAARVHPPSAWLVWVEAAIAGAADAGAAEALRERALAAAPADPPSAVRIALDLMKNVSTARGLDLLRRLPTVRGLPDRQAAEVISGFLSLEEDALAEQWLAERLEAAAGDDARVSLLALVAVSLVDAHRRPDLARRLAERAAPLAPAVPVLKDSLTGLVSDPAPDNPRSFEVSVGRLERLRRHRDTVDRGRPWMARAPWTPLPAEAPAAERLFALPPAPERPALPPEAFDSVVLAAVAELAAAGVDLSVRPPEPDAR